MSLINVIFSTSTLWNDHSNATHIAIVYVSGILIDHVNATVLLPVVVQLSTVQADDSLIVIVHHNEISDVGVSPSILVSSLNSNR